MKRHSINTVIINGFVATEPKIKYSTDGTAVCSFVVGTRTAKSTEYFPIVVFGRLAEVCSEFLKKGRDILINGTVRQNRWKDENGNTKSRIVIRGKSVDFLRSYKTRQGTP